MGFLLAMAHPQEDAGCQCEGNAAANDGVNRQTQEQATTHSASANQAGTG
ncbi:MAG: hypothetical protein H7Y33_11485 [Cytophagales bacterium]|nr:hypothetical protein [Rhizobacter sp.]